MKRVLLALALVALVTLAACGSGTSQNDTTTDTLSSVGPDSCNGMTVDSTKLDSLK
jgi:ABC-type glycerol-3-phosphate transport system substrate-binding protein